MDGLTLGSERNSHFGNWSRHGINRVSHVWDDGREWLRSLHKIRAQTHSMNALNIRSEVICVIPRGVLPRYEPKTGDWIFTSRLDEEFQVSYLKKKENGRWKGSLFHQVPQGAGLLQEIGTE